MIRRFAWLIAAIILIGVDAEAACRENAEGLAGDVCGTSAEQAYNKALEAGQVADDNRAAYCAANPKSSLCSGVSGVATTTPQCPPGQVWSGGPATSASCIPADVPLPPRKPPELTGKPASSTATSTTSSSGNKPANQDDQVSSATNQKATRCKELADAAASTCDSAMNAVRALSGEVSRNAGAMSQGGAKGCEQTGATANNAANQMQSHRNSCQSAVNQCNSTCDSALSDLEPTPTSAASVRASQARASCQSASASMSNMDLNIQQARTAANQANQCYQQITGSSIPGMSGNASDSPSMAAAPATDCTNPSVASSNPVCVCQTNPAHPMCGSVTASADYVGAGAVKPDLPTGTGGGRGSPITLGGSGEGEGLPQDRPTSPLGRMAQRPGGVGGIGGSGGAALPTPAGFRGGARPPSRFDPNVLKGGGAGGSSGRGRVAGGGYPEAGPGPSGKAKNMRADALAKNSGRHVDLRRFLPSDGRGGRAPSSITASIGLRHTNIWTTVNGRYRRVADSLDP